MNREQPLYVRRLLTAVLLFGLVIAVYGQVQVGPPDRLSPDLEVREIRPGVFVITHSFPWPGNSLLVLGDQGEAILVDTPYTPEATALVLDWVTDELSHDVTAAINTGFHVDNLGGNRELVEREIPVAGSHRTVELIEERGAKSLQLMVDWLPGPRNRRFREYYEVFEYVPPSIALPLAGSVNLVLAGEEIQIIFPGETHSPDNTAVFFPERGLLFGGCMILAGDSVGNTADANMATWADAVASLRQLRPDVVVPGHGLRFDPGLIQHTIDLLP
jgi:glyoxylase-like metal-dependent hydrolase (beta-lactamase superfamily II)